MPLKDLLIHLDSYPYPTPSAEIADAVAFAASLGATLTALAVGIRIPLESNRIADYLIGLSKAVAEQEAESDAACRKMLAEFTAKAQAAQVFGEAVGKVCDLYGVNDLVVREARTRDLCLIPLGPRYSGQQEVAEAVVFQSGRPVLIFTGGKAHFAQGLKRVVVAWDGSACAARAVAEALPLLRVAAEVRILAVLGEKPTLRAGMAPALVRHLAAHGISGDLDEVEAHGSKIGDVLDAYLHDTVPDLLVMGAYGHSRLREFILGGATEHMITAGKVPTFLSH